MAATERRNEIAGRDSEGRRNYRPDEYSDIILG